MSEVPLYLYLQWDMITAAILHGLASILQVLNVLRLSRAVQREALQSIHLICFGVLSSWIRIQGLGFRIQYLVPSV